jgi:hypothetical protein
VGIWRERYGIFVSEICVFRPGTEQDVSVSLRAVSAAHQEGALGLCDYGIFARCTLGTALDFFAASDIPYHGHTLSVEWNKQTGLRVTADGTREYVCPVSAETALEILL